METKIKAVLQNLKEEITSLEKSQADIAIKSILLQAEYSYFGLLNSLKAKVIKKEILSIINPTMAASDIFRDSIENIKSCYQRSIDDPR